MSQYLNACYTALEAYTPGEQPRDMQYIKLNTNESPYPPAPAVCQALDTAIVENLRLYSDPTCRNLKQKLADLYGVKPQNLFLTNGSDDILNFAFMAFGEKGAAFADITYGFYSVFADLHGIESDIVPLKEDFTLDYSDYCGRNKLIVIANPNAPTGMDIPLWQIEEILKTNPNNVVVIDEAYVDFGGNSALQLISKYENLLVTRTYSKSRCMAGARLGYAFGSEVIVADLEKLRYSTNPYNINSLTLKLGETTVDANDYYVDKCTEIIKTREFVAAELKKLGFAVLPSKANFVFAKSPTIKGADLYTALRKNGILIRHFNKDRICDYIRITIGTREQMETFISVITQIQQEAEK